MDSLCVIMGDTRPISLDLSKFWNVAVFNNYSYAKTHGYGFQYFHYKTQIHSPKGECRHPSWYKLKATASLSKQFDAVAWIDSDAIFIGQKPIKAYVEEEGLERHSRIFASDIPASEVNCNCGFFILRNDKENQKLLKEWWAIEEWASHHLFEQSVYNRRLLSRYETGKFSKGFFAHHVLSDPANRFVLHNVGKKTELLQKFAVCNFGEMEAGIAAIKKNFTTEI
jgi:hypothetical protein